MTTIFFNLFVNSICSLFAGLLTVHFFLWLFRIGIGPWRLFLLSLPFAKIVFDFAKGIPKESILNTAVDTFSLPPRSHLLTIGAGFNEWGPRFNFQFSVKDSQGKNYAESVGDYLVLWLNKTFGHELPLVIVSSIAAASGTLLVIRLIQALRFENERRIDRADANTLRKISLGRRNVDLYESERFVGSPFTGGIFQPYICIPSNASKTLSPHELDAVIAHELGHVRQFDLATTILIQILGDLFWFVPGYRILSRKIDRLREIVADQWAVRSGTDPLYLASALLKLKEIPVSDNFVLYSAFFREKSLLKARVERLLGEPSAPKARLGWQNRWIRLVVSFWICTAVMTATFGGNHPLDNTPVPAWAEKIFRRWGWM
jgi:beta-lactamase regulating signal transducer with metallopeptidase domain